ncbi:alpha/beta fold hydrolase [Thermaurantiacus sp.]
METQRLPGWDGAPLAVQLMGAGQPLLLLHGLFSNAEVNWVRYGTARRLAEAGYRLILPDFRGHGASASPEDPADWPKDVLARDIEAILAALNTGPDLVLGGYSLGARTVVRLLVRGKVQPRAAILAGMGLDGIVGGEARAQWFLRMIAGRGSWARGTPEFAAETFMNANVRSPLAMTHLLGAQVATPAEALASLALPVAVVCGTEDEDNGSAEALMKALPNARLVPVPGNHMSAVAGPGFAAGLLEALAGFRGSA